MPMLLVCALLIAALSGDAAGLPTVAQASRPARIVCLVPAVTEMLFAVGAGPQVVAVSSFDHHPPAVEHLARVGALLDPDLERILSLRPDLVITYGTQTELRAQLDRARIPQFVYTHGGFADVWRTIREIGARVGRAEAAARLAAAIEAAIERIRQRVAGRDTPATLLVIGREAGAVRGIIASGGVGFLHEMLEIAGARNVFADIARESVQATTELVLARRPAVILEIRGSPLDEARVRAEERAWRPLASVPAVRDGRVHIIGDERTVIPGPRIAEGAELLARAIHPGAFE